MNTTTGVWQNVICTYTVTYCANKGNTLVQIGPARLSFSASTVQDGGEGKGSTGRGG